MYILYVVLLDKCVLVQIGAYYIFYSIFYAQSHNTPIKFLAPLPRTNKSLMICPKPYQVYEEMVLIPTATQIFFSFYLFLFFHKNLIGKLRDVCIKYAIKCEISAYSCKYTLCQVIQCTKRTKIDS